MLKPKKKLTRKEIKKDPVLEKVASTYGFVQEKQTLLTRIGIGLVVGIFLIIIWNNNQKKNEEESRFLFSKALISWQADDVDDAQLQFESLAEEFSGTKNGILASYYLGVIAFNSGEMETAKSFLNDFVRKSDIDILLPNAYRILADICLKNEEIDNAFSHFTKAIKYSQGENELLQHKLNLATYYFSQHKIDDAKTLVSSILESKNISSNLKTKAEELSGKLSM
jgi:tetratricopeptide (TPR) repeat protein